MDRLLIVSQFIDRMNNYLGRVVSWLALVMIGVGTWNVIGRYVGRAIGQNLSSNALLETQWYIFDIIFLLGAAYTLKHHDHVRVDVIQSRLNVKQKALVDLLGTALFLIPFSVMIIFYSWGLSPTPG
ncbi:Tripartite ATP-independent transporter, DctQ component [Limnospira platensis C1]|nr:Tripartite ATP-independent transporter, DctQ component [Arthrospira platensis C1]